MTTSTQLRAWLTASLADRYLTLREMILLAITMALVCVACAPD